MFIKQGPENSNNMVLIEYGFDGSYKRGKHWGAPYDCRYRTRDVFMVDNNIYITGTYFLDTLQLDDQKLSTFLDIGTQDVFVGMIDYATLECSWLQRIAGTGAEWGTFSVNNENEVAVTGWTDSDITACNDTLVNPAAGFTTDMYISKLSPTGECLWLTQVATPISEGGSAIGYLSDGSVVATGYYNGSGTDFGDTVLVNPGIGFNSFVAKYSGDGVFQKALQLEGAISQGIYNLAITDNDEIWIGGSYSSDPLVIGQFVLPSRNSKWRDAFVAKFDKNLNPIYAESLGGTGDDLSRALKKADNGKIYLQVISRSDTLEIGGEIFFTSSDDFEYFILEIEDTTFTNTTGVATGTERISIFPNPLEGGSSLSFELSTGQGPDLNRITFYSLYGQKVGTVPIKNKSGKGSIRIPDFPAGVYFIDFEFDHFNIAEKIIVK